MATDLSQMSDEELAAIAGEPLTVEPAPLSPSVAAPVEPPPLLDNLSAMTPPPPTEGETYSADVGLQASDPVEPVPAMPAPAPEADPLATYSDADLERIAAQAPAAPAPNLSKLSDADLYRAAKVDPLTDFDAYNAFEDEKEKQGYDPADPGLPSKIYDGVAGFVKSIGAFGTEFLYNQGEKWMAGGPADPKQERLKAAVDRERATAISAVGRTLGNFNQIGLGAARLGEKIGTGTRALITTDPKLDAQIKIEARRNAWQFARDQRELQSASENFRQNLGVIFPEALGQLAQVEINEQAAEGASNVLDPTNYIPIAKGAGWALRLPMNGAVRAAERATMEAALDVAKANARVAAADVLVQGARVAGTAATIRPALTQAAEEASRRLATTREAYFNTVAKQQGELAGLVRTTEAVPAAQAASGAAMQGAGRVVDAVGRGVQAVAAFPDALARRLAPANDAAQAATTDVIQSGVRNVAGAFGVLPAISGVVGRTASRVGQDMRIIGEVLSQAEGQLPFFRNVARQTGGVTSWLSSAIDESRLAPLLTAAGRTAAEGVRGAPVMGALGYVSSGGDTDQLWVGAGTGTLLGMAGASAGQWRRYAQPEVIRARQGADVQRYRDTLAGQGEQASAFFERLPNRDQVALATFQLAHPDLAIRYAKLGPGRSSFYTTGGEGGPVAMVNLDSRDPIRAVAAHEVAHHIEKHGLFPVIQRELLGDPEINRPGIYTLRDKAGNPVKDSSGRYQTTPEWEQMKQAYQARLDAEADRTGLPLGKLDDAGLAREIFAEQGADYLLGTNPATGETNIAAAMRGPSSRIVRALAETHIGQKWPFIQRLAGKTGVIFDQSGGVVGSRLFSEQQMKQTTDLRRLVERYERENAQRAKPEAIDDEGKRGTVVYQGSEIRANPQILQTLFDASSDIARGPDGKPLLGPDGSPRFLTGREIDQANKTAADKVWQWYEANPADRGGLRVEKIKDEKTGKEVDGIVGPLPAPLLESLAKDKNFNPVQLENLRLISEGLATQPGNMVSMFYQPATRGGGDRRYRSLSGDWRTEAPYAIAVTKAGNIIVRTMSKEKLVSNAEALIKRGQGKLWGDNIGALVGDIDTYLANHAAGQPGGTGIGEAKRDIINELFGIAKKGMEGVNPLFDTLPRRSPVVIRSRRIDRMNRVAPVEGERFPTNYEMIRANRRPEMPDNRPPAAGSPQSGPKPTEAMTSGYELGKKTGERFDSLRQFWAAVGQGDAEAPSYTAEPTSIRALFWEAGFLGQPMPRWVKAERIGRLPVAGRSTNFREQQMESGVSVLRVVGEKRSDDGTFEAFNDGERFMVEGWLSHRKGTDGEPLLVGAVESPNASPKTPIDPDPISVSPETRTRFTREEYSVFRGEGTAPTITEAVIRGGDISRVSESRYPIVELSLSNGAKLAKKIRVSDHGQVSQFSPGEYGIDVRGSKLSDEQVVERAMDQLQEWVTEVWRDQGNIPKSSLRTNRADSSVIEQYNASNRKLAEAKSKLMTEVNANSTQRRIWQGAVDKYSLAIERLKRDFPGVSLPQ